MSSTFSFLEIKDLSINLESQKAIDAVNLKIFENSNIGIVGETGSGKTTLLKGIAGLIHCDTGGIWFNQIKIKGPSEQLIPGHPSIAYLHQHSNLKNNYRVWELFEFFNHLSIDKIDNIIKICAIKHLTSRWTNELSGGEKQRVALALLLMNEPKVLLLDEPYSNLDNIHKEQIKSVIKELSKKLSVTCIMVSHDIPDLLSWADEILVMKDGKIIQIGDSYNIYHKPETIYCAAILGSYQLLKQSLCQSLQLTIPDFPTGKKLLIRPSYIEIDNNSEKENEFSIVTIEFKGEFSVVGININNQVIKLISNSFSNLTLGDKVNVKYLPSHFSFL